MLAHLTFFKKCYWGIVDLQHCVNFWSLSYTYILFFIFFPLWFITGCWIYSICYTVGSCYLFLLYITVCICKLKLPVLPSPTPTPLGNHRSVLFVCAAAAAKSLQSCPCDPIDGSPPGSPIPGILQARTGVGCHFLLQGMTVKSEKWKWSRSVMSDSSWPHGLQPTRLLRPWDSPGKSTGAGCHCLLPLSVSLFLFHRYVHLSCILDPVCQWYQVVFVFLFLTYFTWYNNL